MAMPLVTLAESELVSSMRNVSLFSTFRSEKIVTNLHLSSPGDAPAPSESEIGAFE